MDIMKRYRREQEFKLVNDSDSMQADSCLKSEVAKNKTTGATVVLTGSTGNLGAYLLDELLNTSEVRKVICLNRSQNASTRQQSSMRDRGLGTDFESAEVSFTQADYSQERLGLDQHTYDWLLRETDIVLHNAWPVDFNRNFHSFKPSIAGVENLIKFCTGTKEAGKPCKLIFISSMAATSNWASAAPTSRAKIPECEVTDFKVARTGYGQSKLLSERLLAHAASNLGLQATVIRVGQLAGPVLHGLNGKWPEQEWVPSLIRSSVMLGTLPHDLGPISCIDWIPVDLASRSIREILVHELEAAPLAVSRRRGKVPHARFYHIVSPQTIKWHDLVPHIQRHMAADIKLVPFVDWVKQLRESVEGARAFSGVDDGKNPAAKLMDFWTNLEDRAIRFPKSVAVELATKETVKVSTTIASLPAIGDDWVELWMQQWNMQVAYS